MGRRIVRISGELFTEMITEGWQCGGHSEVVRCIKGLPAGAKYVGAGMLYEIGDRMAEPRHFAVKLFYDHPDWPDDFEVINVEFETSFEYRET